MTDAEAFDDTHRDRFAGAASRETTPVREPVSRMADAVRALCMDATEAAGSGDLGFALGMADAATALWTRVQKFDAADPRWPDRDRFVLSAGHGAALLYALLCLTGHEGMDADALRGFRRLHSPASGHPEHGRHPAIEATTGPHGQGLATAVGMALAERMLAARFGRSLVDHRTWVMASAADLSGGLACEALSLAGQLRLEKLTVLVEDRSDGGADALRLLGPHGWAVKEIDGSDPAQLAAALSWALRSKKPSAIACRIGAARASRDDLGWPEPAFGVPGPLRARWLAAGGRGAGARRAWLKRLARHPMRAEFERVTAGRLPEDWRETAAALREADPLADGPPPVPELVFDADGGGSVAAGSYAGRRIPYAGRTQAMAAAMNGVALHAGLIPCGAAKLAQSDALRPALRLAAQMRLRTIHVLTDDGICVGADGPAHQPVEQLAGLRAMPNVAVMRPADRIEAAECWDLALRRADGPSLIVLSARPLPALPRTAESGGCARGGYVAAEAEGPRRATLIATGAELHVAVEARALLAEQGIAAALVSLPCWRLFEAQDEMYRARVLGSAPRFGIEAACGFGWDRWLGPEGVFIGMTGYGASAPAYDLYRYFGITAEAVSAAVVKRLGS